MTEDRQPLYKVGDRVRIINYGHLIWINKIHFDTSLIVYKRDGDFMWCDLTPDIIGQEGVISKISLTQNIPTYAVDGIPEKHAWYNESQLEKA